MPAVLLGGLSLVYYAAYFDAGFNFADEGNYAQFAYELALGTSLNDLPVGYGFLWFKVGEGLFRLFGPDLLLARLLFFACMFVTALLVYSAIVLVTGQRWFAAALAAVPMLAPAFPPTAFYGVCVLVNTVPQLRLARRLTTARPRDAALAGVALALSFQVRPDFGYIFAAPLAALLALSAWQGADTRHARLARGRELFLAAAAAVLIAHAPGLFLAFNDGYLAALAGQYLSYPVMLAEYGWRGVATLFGFVDATGSGGVLLRRPNLFGAADASELRLALLVYLPVIIIVGFAVHASLALRRGEDRIAQSAVSLVVLITGAAALPHYFFYRPDLSHIANFIAGFTVLAGTFVWSVARRVRPPTSFGIMLFVAATLGIYLWTALTSEGTGSIAGSAGRTQRFVAENGVDVRLYPGEKAMLEELKAIIEGNSAKGDSIVCVPYCPGIAFMTGRRLLFSEQYVDDSLPLRDPGWIARAIGLTRERRPPVVIVMDWAINGTDASRFSRWASAYMEVLESLAREKLDRPGYAIYLL